ncbi:MAG: alpha/beta fold hydrolase [Luteolibacter sp.]|nr:alpha/beta fold hydrolase [Luteolibacter sp.]
MNKTIKRKQFISMTAILSMACVSSMAILAAEPLSAPQDIVFKAKVDGTEQRYVLMLPAGFDARQTHHLLVALHGHGSDRWQFAKDSRDECRAARDFAAAHEFIYVSPDYRATSSWMGPKAEADMGQILDELGGRFRLGKVIMCGASMGGTSALIFAVQHPEKVQGVVAMNATANLVEFTGFPEAIAASYGGTRKERPDEYRKRSVELWPERLTMPIALTAGGMDEVVPPHSLLRLAKKLQQQKRRTLTLYRPMAGHSTNFQDTLAALEFIFGEINLGHVVK